MTSSQCSLFLVVEDHPEVAQNNCDWLQKLEPEARCIMTSAPEQALERLTLETPDLIVVDLLYGRLSGEQSAQPGLDLLQHILEQYPTLNILVYTSDPGLLRPLKKRDHQGGFAVVNKIERRERFLEGARSALNGYLWGPREILQEIPLTDQDKEVLGLICLNCLTDPAIADRLHISLRAAQTRVQRLKAKLAPELDKELDKHINFRVSICMQAVKRKLISF